MNRPTSLEFSESELPWQSAPMPGSNLPLELRRLSGSGDAFVIHGRFPIGFERAVPGGYAVPEDVIILRGELRIQETIYRRGDLISIPANFERTFMSSPGGCDVIAWFGGPPIFVRAADLPPVDSREPVLSTISYKALGDVNSGEFLRLPHARWVRTSRTSPLQIGTGDSVATTLERWSRHENEVISVDSFARLELATSEAG